MTPGPAPHPLLVRLADPAPIAWTTVQIRQVQTAQGAIVEAELSALGRPWRLRWTPDPAPTLLLDRVGRTARSGNTTWIRALLLPLPERHGGWAPHDVPAALEAARQAGRAADALARLALLLDLARLHLQRQGHAHGGLSSEAGLYAVEAPTSGALSHRVVPLPQTLPEGLARDVLSSVLVPSAGHLRTAAGIRHDLDAPGSAHAALDLRRQIVEALAATPQPWQGRLAAALPD